MSDETKKDSVSEDLARLFGVTPEELIRLFDLSEEQLMELDEVEFRARTRERCHHTMEIPTYESAYFNTPLPADQTATIEKMLRVWDKRGFSHDLVEYRFATTILGFAKKRIAGEPVDLSAYEPKRLTPDEQAAFDCVLYERRSIRQWNLKRHVDDALIDKVLKAGLWGPHGCNLQSVRYMVIREDAEPGLFEGSDVPGGPIHIVVMQDKRCYQANPLMPEFNILLDCGAATQNIVLAVHAYGLGGCWLTFSDVMRERFVRHFSIPDHFNVVTYVDIGWPDQSPCPIWRCEVEEAVVYRSSGRPQK
ncbi:MAG: nitroreductase family protein [Synergistaceae bacterium]|nr:nitroreductase family protein [Synergistaceae bacterium]